MKPDFFQGPMQPAEPTHCPECDQLIEDCRCGECRCGKWLHYAEFCSVCQHPCCSDHCQVEQGTTLCDECREERIFELEEAIRKGDQSFDNLEKSYFLVRDKLHKAENLMREAIEWCEQCRVSNVFCPPSARCARCQTFAEFLKKGLDADLLQR